jgi:hypothetical protein
MDRRIAIVGAPTSIGIRPYDSGETRHLDRAPGVLRELGLVERLSAEDRAKTCMDSGFTWTPMSSTRR